MVLHNKPKLVSAEKIGRLTTDQYFEMIKTGIIREGAPYELLDGLLMLKDRSIHGEDIMTIGGPHTIAVGILSDLTPRLLPHGCYMQTQSPIRIPPYNAPEPDGAIVKGTRRDYPDLPGAADVCSVIEVGDSSLAYDRVDKGGKYAESGIPQFVLIDLIHRVVEIYEAPNVAKRKYGKSKIAKPGQKVGFFLKAGARLEVAVNELLP